ncbi:MAG: M12 family metallo-peptidase, partial [Burkholderiales bacterium]|nr:M12 family metallo-peptidase [Burkholderiales bacterium]
VLRSLHKSVTAEQPQTIRIELFEDTSLLVKITRTELVGRRATAYIGTVSGAAFSSVVIVEEDGVLAGNIDFLGHKYQIRNFGESSHVMRQIDASALPPDHVEIPKAGPSKAIANSVKDRVVVETAITATNDDGSLIDVMVVYTPAARISQGGTAAMNALVNLGVAETNNAYANSQVRQRVRLVYAGEVNYAEVDFVTDLARLQATTDGFMDEVHLLRDLYGADLVSLWGNYSGGCGLANLMLNEAANFAAQGFNVVERNCATSNLSFAHELGHNMGLQHDEFDGNSGTTVTPEGSTIPTPINYAHGYVDLRNQFRSVMAISAQCDAQSPVLRCERIPYFSNPAVLFGGAATGNGNSQEGRALNDTRETTANFRASVDFAGAGTVIFLPASYSVSESASSITLSAARHAGTGGAVSVRFSTLSVTAVAGTDYTAASGVLTWANGESGPKSITIPILQDGVLDGPKTFAVLLDNPAGGVSVGVPGGTVVIATVTVLDAETDSFPAGCSIPLTGWTIDPPGWSVTSDSFFGPACSLKSNPTADGGSAKIHFTGNFTDGTISFARRVSSQNGSDCLRFFIDGTERLIGGTCASFGGLGASGEMAWGIVNHLITAGIHTITWSYEKDGAGAGGADAAWIDSVVLPLAGPPAIQSAPPPGGFLNVPYSYKLIASGGAPIAYALLAATLPDGLILNTVTGNISGIPSRLGTFTGFIRAFNDFPPFAQQPFSITIVGAVPGPPVIGSAVPGNGLASVGLTPPISPGSAPITGYTSTCNPGAITGSNSASPVIVDGLVNGVEYNCAVAASNIYGSSGSSASVLVTPFATGPGAPSIGAATPGNTQAFIGFLPPISDGGLPITGYTATCVPGTVTGTGSHSPIVVNNLLNRALYNCAVSATNALGTSNASATAAVIPSSLALLTLIDVVSRKTHGLAGVFDLSIDSATAISGPVTVEPRSIGSAGSHSVVFKFNNTVGAGVVATVVNTANVQLPATVAWSGTEVIVTIPNIADATRVSVSISGVNGSTQAYSISLGFLLGDVTNSRVVSASDVNRVKARSGRTTSASNYKFDINTNGSISASDVLLLKSRSGTVLP